MLLNVHRAVLCHLLYFFFLLTGSMDLSIAFQSCPPHVSLILSVVRVLPSLHPLTEIYLKFVREFCAFIMPQCCLQESVWEYLTLVIAMQRQSVAVSAHHRPLPPQRRRADEVLLPGVPLFYAQPSHFTLSKLFSFILMPCSSGRINTNNKQWY